jgi:hypothetical protein
MRAISRLKRLDVKELKMCVLGLLMNFGATCYLFGVFESACRDV